MNVYVHAFKFREPFQVIVDDELVLASQKSAYNLRKGLERTIQGEIKPMITQCCIQALYKSNDQGAIDVAKTFERRRCNHPPSDPLPPIDCIKSIVLPDNKFKYILAIQKFELRKVIRNIPGVPLVFFKNSVMIMDSISKATVRYAEQLENSKLSGGLNDVSVGLKHEDSDEDGNNPEENIPKKKRKGPKGPNPLSIKKKKLETQPIPNQVKDKKTKRKRKHKHKRDNDKDESGNVVAAQSDPGHSNSDQKPASQDVSDD